MEEFKTELKKQIIETLSLEEMTPDEIDNSAPLFGKGLGLDSIDVLELIVMLERKYGIRLGNPAEGKAVFASIDSLAEYIGKNRKK